MIAPQLGESPGRSGLNGTSDVRHSVPPYLDWRHLDLQEPPARMWFVADWLTTGATLLAAGGGMGKTLIAQSIATALATSRSFISHVRAEAVSLMWACEDDSDELWRRQRAICSSLDVSMPALEDMFYLSSRYGCDNALYAMVSGRPMWTDAFKLLRQQVLDTHCDVLWLDNIGHVFGAEENNRHHVTAFVNGLQALQSKKPMAVVLLGHPAKAAGSEYSGSTAWENAVRMRWYLGSKLPGENGEVFEDDTVRYLYRRKANYTSRDYCRLTYANGVLVPDAPGSGTFSSRYGAQERAADAQQVVLDGFDRCMQSGITPSDSPNAQDYLPKKLVAMGLHGGHATKELASAMHMLIAARTLVRGTVGHYSNRTPKQGLIRP